MNDWIAFLLEVQRRQETAVVITVAATRGSVPRAAGTKISARKNYCPVIWIECARRVIELSAKSCIARSGVESAPGEIEAGANALHGSIAVEHTSGLIEIIVKLSRIDGRRSRRGFKGSA